MKYLLIITPLLFVSCWKEGGGKLPDGLNPDIRLGLCLKGESEKRTLKTLSDVAEAGYFVSKTCGVSIEKVIPYLQLVENEMEIRDENS